MNKITQRSSSPMAEMLEWLESNSPLNVRGLGLAPYVRVEDYIEDDTYVLRAELPGIDPEKDVEVKLEYGKLTITGTRHEESKDKNHREFHYGAFRRTVSLPSGVKSEDVTASYRDGVLEIRVPTKETETTTVHIPITRPE